MALPPGGRSERASKHPAGKSSGATGAKAAEAAARAAAAQRTQQAAKQRAANRNQAKATTQAKRSARKARRAEKRAATMVRWRRNGHRIRTWLFPATTRRIGRPFSVVVLILNVFPFPGLGTALYGHWERGLAQFLLTFLFLLGWVWAIADATRILIASWRPHPALRAAAAKRRL